MDDVHEAGEVVGIGSREDAVPEVEDVARPAGGLAEDRPSVRGDRVERADEEAGVQVALDAAVMPDDVPARIEVDPPVEADDVAAGRGLQGARMPAETTPKWIVGTPSGRSASKIRAIQGATERA